VFLDISSLTPLLSSQSNGASTVSPVSVVSTSSPSTTALSAVGNNGVQTSGVFLPLRGLNQVLGTPFLSTVTGEFVSVLNSSQLLSTGLTTGESIHKTSSSFHVSGFIAMGF